jgi:protein-S-isoprenylcysteine O-methyltransferase Ste14
MITAYQNEILLIAVSCLGILGLTRLIVLRTQKTKVLVFDSQMSKRQLINGLVFVVCFFIWVCESLSYGLSLKIHIPPEILHLLLLDQTPVKIIGALFMVTGLVLYALALIVFGNSWRIGIDRERFGELVTSGIFSWSRNPIYVSLDLLVLGTFFLQGYLIFLIISLFFIVNLHIQILEEETFLHQQYGADYVTYCSNVGRYFNIP